MKTGVTMAVAISRTGSAGLDLQAMIHHHVMQVIRSTLSSYDI